MKNFKLFGEFAKAEKQDDGTIILKGIASTEAVDSDGEIITADAMRKAIPSYMKFGNVREMHRADSAVGTAISIGVNDDGQTEFEAHIVDPVAVKKCETGVYKGFSIGGKKLDRDELNKRKITAVRLTEISVVDRPSNPDAVFELAKAEGADGELELTKVAAREDVSPEAGEEEYGDVKFADAKNKKYPIDTEAHIRAAWNYINKPKNAAKYSDEDVKSIKSKIVAAWKSKIDKDGPPSAAKDDAKKAEQGGAMKGELENLKKGMYDVSRFADLLCSLGYVASNAAGEAVYEGDSSPVPAKIKAGLAALADAFKEMAAEEVDEMLEGIRVQGGVPDVMALAAKAEDLTKQVDDLQKAGAAFSKATKDKMAKAHDHIKAADAAMTDTGYCATDDDASKGEQTGDLAKAASEEVLAKVARMEGELEDLRKAAAEKDAAIAERDASIKEANEVMDDLLKKFNDRAPAVLPAGATVLEKSADSGKPAAEAGKEGGTTEGSGGDPLEKSHNEAKGAIKKILSTGPSFSPSH